MGKISVVVVDDHRLMRELLIDLLNKNVKYEVVGHSAGCQEATNLIGVLQPDVVLLDINLSDGSGLDIIHVINKVSKKTRIVVLSMHFHPAYAQKAITFGGHAYVTKDSSPGEIYAAIDEVIKNGKYICSQMTKEFSLHLLTTQLKKPDTKILSLREKQILQYVKQGISSKDIAVLLNIKLKTVQAHRYNIFKKLKVKNVTTLVNYVNKMELDYGVL